MAMKRKPVPRICRECGAEFISNPTLVKADKANYCSYECLKTLNRVRIEGDVAYLELTTKRREPIAETAIDVADIDKAFSIGKRWSVASSGKYGGQRVVANHEGKRVFLHRILTDAAPDAEVDHIDGDSLNNRRSSNLRVVNHGQNMQNRKGVNSGEIRKSRTGVRGVSWHAHTKKYRVRVGVNYKQILVGYFDTIEEAEAAVIEARRKLMTHSND